MRTIRNQRAALSAMLALAACAPAATRSATSRMPEPGISLTVANQNWLDVTVYALRGASRVRIGQVTGNGTAQLSIPRNLIVAGQLRLMADPVGSNERYISDPISVDPDQRVQLTVAPAMAMSSYAVRVR